MAESRKLQMTFLNSNGASKNFSFSNIKDRESLVDANVKALMEGMIGNGDIYETPPAAIVSAKIVETTETAVDLS